MRKLLILGLLLIAPILCQAGPDGEASTDAYKDVIMIGCDQAVTAVVTCSSVTATEIRPSNEFRKKIFIQNVESSQVVYISTYAATATTALIRVSTGGSITSGNNPYTGAIYGLSDAGATAEIRVLEEW